MKHVNFLAAAALSLVAITSAQAEPYCLSLNSKETLPSKYQKRGPFYSDAASGWIIGDDQMRGKFAMSAEASGLLAEIRSEFELLGVKLAVMAAPPRPLFAPQEVRTAMGKSDYDANAAASGFSNYITSMNDIGIEAPDLFLAASAADRPYYFQRDTHWTPSGAALSAKALAAAIGMGTEADEPNFDEAYDEKGSLSMVVEATCGARPVVETVAAPVFAKTGDANALLGDTTGPALALVGTSFSDRYQRDAYRVADAVAHYTGASVENFSVSGGGVAGAMEAFIRSGRIAEFEVVVWEAPYTEPLTSVSALRQILGALISQRMQGAGDEQVVELSSEWTSVSPSIELGEKQAIELAIDGADAGQLDVELYDAKNKKTRIKLRKSDRVNAALRSDIWTVALGQIDPASIVRIKLRLKGAKGGINARLRAL